MGENGLIVFIKSQASVLPCSNILSIISKLSSQEYLILIADEKLDISSIKGSYKFYKKIKCNVDVSLPKTAFYYLKSQLEVSFSLLKLYKSVDTWFFFMGDTSIIPLLLLKVLKKRSILCLAGSLEKDVNLRAPPLSKLIILNGKLGLRLSDKIIVYSKSLIDEWNLNEYNEKILIASRHYLDSENFRIYKEFSQRCNSIGYIGRLSQEKGTMNFVKSIKLLKDQDLKFLLIGDGNLRSSIEQYIAENRLDKHIEYLGWISHKNLPHYLNNLKLLVIPSYTEGLPNVMLEAMACGTPVLATSVGAISDIIKDGETGFIMENNSPDCISENITRALNHPQLENIIHKARELVMKEYTYDAAVQRYMKILGKLEQSKNSVLPA